MVAVFSKEESEFFAVVSWWIWKNRNDVQFGKVGISGEHLVHNAGDWMNEFAGAQPTLRPDPLRHDTTSLPSTTQTLKWCPPQSHFVKLNVDAACDNHKCRTGLGAIIQNDRGKFVCSYGGYARPHPCLCSRGTGYLVRVESLLKRRIQES